MLTLYGSHGSPYTRKACLFLEEKGQPYQFQFTFPGNSDPEWRKISPLGKVPCLKDDGFALPDSSAICEYLERKFPEPPLYPKDLRHFGRALWYEEYADSAVAAILGGKIFFPKVVAPLVLKQPVDEAAIQKVVERDVPKIFNYLEGEVRAGQNLVGDEFGIADLGVMSHLLSYQFAGYSIDPQRWPQLSAYFDRQVQRPSFQKYVGAEKQTFAKM